MTRPWMTRRSMVRLGVGMPLAAFGIPGRAFAKDFWNDRKPEDWTSAEIKELLSKSPWAKDAAITDNGQVGGLGSPRSARRGRAGSSEGGSDTPPSSTPKITWKAIVRWESALPVREAMKASAPKDFKDFYVLNVVGNVPSPITSGDTPEDRSSMAYLKEVTKLSHKGDEIHMARVELALASDLSPAGTRFYFSRTLALMPEDKEAEFVTKIGPLDLKCKFTLKDMFYKGQLDL